jgi:glycerol-3-phosphate dehydrogenase
MNVALILSAVKAGATVANYCQVVGLNKAVTRGEALEGKEGKICGARVRDNLTGEVWDVRAKVSLVFQRYDLCSNFFALF